MKRITKRVIAPFIIIAMLSSTLVMGCGAEDKPTETVNKFCSSLLTYDIKTAVTYTNDTASGDALDLESQMTSGAAKVVFNGVKEAAKKNSFKIANEEKVDATHYKVTVTFTLQDLSNLQTLITDELKPLVLEYYSSTGKSLDSNNEEDYNKIVELMDTATKKVISDHTFETESYDCQLNLEKVNDKWIIMDPDSISMTHILIMGISGL